MKHKHNARCGEKVCFHGAFRKKAEAVEKEKKTPKAFVKSLRYGSGDYRYAVMTPRENPPKKRKKRKTNPILTREEKRKIKRKIKRAVKGTVRRGVRSLLGLNKPKQKPNPRKRVTRRRNPGEDSEAESAREAFYKFHGAESTKVTQVIQELVEQGKYWLLGKLYGYDLAQFPLVKDGRRDERPNVDCINAGIQLCAEAPENPQSKSKQLFLWKGQQDLEWALKPQFGINSNVQFVVLGVISRIWYITRKSFDNFELVTYIHNFGERIVDGRRTIDPNLEKPMLMYDRLNKQHWIVGGDYKISPKGIEN